MPTNRLATGGRVDRAKELNFTFNGKLYTGLQGDTLASALLANGVDVAFMKAKITTARFYADHLLTKAPGIRDSIVDGADCVTALALEAF